MSEITRRDAVASLVAAGLLTPGMISAYAFADEAELGTGLALGDPKPFSFDILKAEARDLSNRPWRDPKSPYSDILEKIDYNAFLKINFRPDRSLWPAGRAGAPIQLFHLGKYSQEPCS